MPLDAVNNDEEFVRSEEIETMPLDAVNNQDSFASRDLVSEQLIMKSARPQTKMAFPAAAALGTAANVASKLVGALTGGNKDEAAARAATDKGEYTIWDKNQGNLDIKYMVNVKNVNSTLNVGDGSISK